MTDTGKTCEECGKPLETDARHIAVIKYCDGHCRYLAWKKRKEKELETLIRQLAGRARL